MRFHMVRLAALVLDNWVALGLGGYAGYKWGHKVETWVSKALSVLKRV